MFFLHIPLQVSQTEQKTDMEKLKVREKIHFYEEMMLFEDELADNGCASLIVKMVSFSETSVTFQYRLFTVQCALYSLLFSPKAFV